MGEKENKWTKRLGLTQEQKESSATLCIPDSIYRLTLAWVTIENSTKQLECRLILTRSSSLSLDPMSCWLASLLRCPVSTASVHGPAPTAVSSFVQPTLFSCPVTTSGHAEISSPKPFVWFRAKTDKGIVCLAGHLHSVTSRVSWIWHKTGSRGEAPVLELYGMWSTSSLPLIPGRLCPEVIPPVRVPSI